jgi:hypothetical protein
VLSAGGVVVVCRGCAGVLLVVVLPCSLELGGLCYVGVHCGGSCVGVRSWCPGFVVEVVGGSLGAATSRGGVGLFALVVVVRWAVLSG